ncbi:tetratricopeptide repeat protein [Dactylosporangium sp. NPDC051541]|uniref:tetratricopeptide repeat protein n=1 Tax=Dactylosporangium sp. NPDC051541 TaxID=3363977 RepID=UPI0037A395AE
MHPRSASGLGALLRRHRLRAGVDQQELARRAGLSVRALRDIEHDRVRRPRAESVRRLADALLLSAADRDALRSALTGDGPVAEPGLRIGVLGALSVRRADGPVEVGSPMLRGLLGLLAMHARQAVPRDEIVDVLWDRPPRSCQNLIHGYIGQLRRLLEPDRRRRGAAGTVRLAPGGYRLDLDAAGLDVVRFDELLGHARAAATDTAAAVRERLAEALDCWRGPVLAGADPRLRQHRTAVALGRRRVDAALTYADLALAGDGGPAAVPRLLSIVFDEPLHEGLHARLALLLAAGGERAEALRVLADARSRLAEELGVEPGEELRSAQLQVLRAGPRPAMSVKATQVAVPGQLLADVATFTGRVDALRSLDDRLAGGGGGVVAIAGTAGIGKTALVMHWAHRVQERFPDGQLYVNLRGYAQGAPLEPIEVLARLLHALGTPLDEVPLEVEEAAGVYRTLLADRRILVVLDNARDAEQVRPLLPGGVGCLALVTSRDRLAGLVAREGAQLLVLDVLAAAEARALLGRIVGAQRLRAEDPAVVDDLVALCGALPLALRIAAANLVCDPHRTVREYVAELRGGDRLTALRIEGDRQTAVEAALDLSYAALPPPARRLFRLLGLVPGPDFTAAAAAALAGGEPVSVGAVLERLARAHLLEQYDRGRFAVHDLLRLYAHDRCAAQDGPDDRQAALGRLFDHYLAGLDAAARLLYPEKLRLPLPSGLPEPVPGFAEPAQALQWVEAERPNLVAAIRHGPRPSTWLLADALRGYFHLSMHTIDWLTVATTGLAAAIDAGDGPAQAVSHLSIADAHWRRSRHDLAVEHFNRALTAARRTGWAQCEASILGNLGAVHWQQGNLRAAGDQIAAALELNRRTGWLAGQAVSLGNLGLVRMQAGQLERAAGHFAEALTLARRTGARSSEANILGNLGEVCQLLGRLDEAVEHLDLALARHRELGGRGNEAANLRTLAATHRDAGRLDRALELARAALEQAKGTDMLRLEIDALNVLGTVQDAQGHCAASVDSHRRALTMARETGEQLPEAEALIGIAAAQLHLGHLDQALADIMRAVTLTQRAGFHQHEGAALTGLAAVHLARGRPWWAVQVGERAAAVHEKTGYRAGAARTDALLRQARAATDEHAAAAHSPAPVGGPRGAPLG